DPVLVDDMPGAARVLGVADADSTAAVTVDLPVRRHPPGQLALDHHRQLLVLGSELLPAELADPVLDVHGLFDLGHATSGELTRRSQYRQLAVCLTALGGLPDRTHLDILDSVRYLSVIVQVRLWRHPDHSLAGDRIGLAPGIDQLLGTLQLVRVRLGVDQGAD